MRRWPLLAGLLLAVVASITRAQTQAPTPPPAAPPADPLAGYITPSEWLSRQPKPKFKEGHTLPMLTRYGWDLDFETQKEFADWGYCLQTDTYTDMNWVDRFLNPDPKDEPAAHRVKLIELVRANPTKYKLAVGTSRELPPYDKAPPETFARDKDGHLLTDQAKSQDGTAWTKGMSAVLSPAAPDSFWEESGRLQAAPLKRLNEAVPITIILNGGEYGLGIAGWSQKVWEKDPAIVKAQGNKSWTQYSSERTGRSQTIIAGVIRKAVPKAEYIYYCAGGSGIRNQYDGWDRWSGHYEDFRGIGKVATGQAYYRDFNDGWLGGVDLLTQFLNARGQEIGGGQPFHYGWLCGGYKQLHVGPDVSDIPRYMGFLRCAYTAGMIGGNAGYYNYPDFNTSKPEDGPGKYFQARRGFQAVFPPDDPPMWMEQMMALSRVHAQFSHLEHYLRQGDLVAGPYFHSWSHDQPAYELLPVELADQKKPTAKGEVKVEQQDATGWEKTEFDDAAWKRIDLPQPKPNIFAKVEGWQGADGVVWFRRTVDIPVAWAGKELVLKLAGCDDSDTTYWNGEKIGQTLYWTVPREYRIPADMVKAGKTVIAVRAEDRFGGGGLCIIPGQAETLSLAPADGTAPISLDGPWKHAIAKAVLAVHAGKTDEKYALLPGRPVRVLARKLKDQPRWLITAWAADGTEREIKVPVPDLGEIALKATAEANVYEATLEDGKPALRLATGGQRD